MRASINFLGKTDPLSETSKWARKQKSFLLFHRVQQAMTRVPDFFEICKAILDAVIAESSAENCSLMLKDPVSAELIIRVARGKKNEAAIYYPEPHVSGRRFRVGEGIAGWVAQEGRTVALNDVKEEPRFQQGGGGSANEVASLMCLPVRERDEIIGVLNISHSKKGAFNDEERMAFGYISNEIGVAAAASRFLSETQRTASLPLRYPEDRDFVLAPVLESLSWDHGQEAKFNKRGFLYAGEKMQKIKDVVDKVADTDVTVLFQGESGVGKEVIARVLYSSSVRMDKPFVRVNCTALPQELVESELFGYERGAFTGAYRQKPGKFEVAHQGTIFLDEISEISLSLQSKLLHVLQDKEFTRLGGNKEIKVDVRVLAATNKNLEDAVRRGLFREDLYYRLNVVNITIPPLRERKEEIPLFIKYFLEKFCVRYSRKAKHFSSQTMKMFMQYPWPGNVRELENIVQRYVVLGDEKVILQELFRLSRREMGQETTKEENFENWPSLREVQRRALIEAESNIIQQALERASGNRKEAAYILNISYKTLLYKMRNCGIELS